MTVIAAVRLRPTRRRPHRHRQGKVSGASMAFSTVTHAAIPLADHAAAKAAPAALEGSSSAALVALK